jgi:hypothetical protein
MAEKQFQHNERLAPVQPLPPNQKPASLQLDWRENAPIPITIRHGYIEAAGKLGCGDLPGCDAQFAWSAETQRVSDSRPERRMS